ncbi:alpha/beta fold hydrolase [Microbacterium marinilacus]|uniref:AB hydrolase-1 domain-containing protein n=1 Tax=Microbacterium marinilacus TaxID=415209 RepID=A0ABP7BWS2_9MICO|nr:alpha/beta fold hydrolase [Microbacterium marinilacus]MBY0688136.1 alpha/beta fold hydrolase [Microbacterium marinilacus]
MTQPALTFTAPVGADGAPLLVLGPSLGTSSILWEDVVPLLAGSFRVASWDLPGHGASAPATAAFTIGELADAVAEGIRELGAPALYAGVSLGGATGLELLLRHPEVVARAAIVCASPRFGDPEAWSQRAAQVRTQGTGSLIVGSAQRWFAPGSIERRPVLTGRLLHTLRDADDASYALCCDALARYDVTARLGEIATPLLAVYGEHDGVSPEEHARAIADGVRDGRLARIDDASHLAPAERPDEVAAVLRDFFGGAR